jgi:hypothetical protein
VKQGEIEMPEPDGIVLIAEPYPDGDDHVALQLGYLESSAEEHQGQPKFRRFSMSRDVTELLSKMLTDLLAAPNAETAWKQIANNSADADCCLAVEEYYAESRKGHNGNEKS